MPLFPALLETMPMLPPENTHKAEARLSRPMSVFVQGKNCLKGPSTVGEIAYSPCANVRENAATGKLATSARAHELAGSLIPLKNFTETSHESPRVSLAL